MQVKGNLKYVVRLEKDLEFGPEDSWEAEAKAAGGDRGWRLILREGST